MTASAPGPAREPAHKGHFVALEGAGGRRVFDRTPPCSQGADPLKKAHLLASASTRKGVPVAWRPGCRGASPLQLQGREAVRVGHAAGVAGEGSHPAALGFAGRVGA